MRNAEFGIERQRPTEAVTRRAPRLAARIRQSAIGTRQSRGFFIIAAVVMLMVIATVTAAFLAVVVAHARVLGDEHRRTAALNLAEAGVEIALARLEQNGNYRGERGVSLGGGKIDIEVLRKRWHVVINARGTAQGSTRDITRRVRVTGVRMPGGSVRIDTWQECGR